MANIYKIKKGLDLKLIGEAEKVVGEYKPAVYAVKPVDFSGILPRLAVNEGDQVKAGSILFVDKHHEKIAFTSPVAGTISEIMRGAKRMLLEIRIKKAQQDDFEVFETKHPSKLSAEEIKDILLRSGVWPCIRQRPYAVIADPEKEPKAIHISCFDSAPLAPDYDLIVHGHGEEFQTGLDALSKLTKGKIHLNVRTGEGVSKVFLSSKGVQINYFEGPHPSGNPGIQIHHIDPVNKGEVVWYLRPQDVLTIGRLFLEGRYNPQKMIALTGGGIKNPKYYKTISGAVIDELLASQLKEGNYRVISGNVLTGSNIGRNGFLGYYDSQVTVIREGDYYEFLGWMSPGLNKLSASRAFISKMFPNKKFDPDTNLHGGERPFVLTGQYEKVLPMDIYPVYLLKAILTQNIDKMEQLGIYEVAEEDFALCEFVCASKIEVQAILRKGLDMMQKEMS
ncbi:MAG: Na(+)-translocating NADH-quinone reductase subunit A [Bacteroidetes bacterium 38_7]|nr:MAG: Na(+)-translocating NADH-quinone reductase subunit A [Bacteroidetes bacterium 38_7]HAL65389.1 NADH:ubiquinone reductase (Na(+)-transporting) subunit A [Bacteroidales bacterium]